MKNHTNDGENLRIDGDNSSIIISEKSDLDLKGGNGNNLSIYGDNSSIIISEKSDLDLKGGNGNNLSIYGDSASLSVTGESSIQAISTGTVQDYNSMEAMIFLGQNHRVKLVENAHVKIDNSEINLTGNIGTGLGLYSNSSKLNLANDARLNISTESNGINGAVRFIEHGNVNITLNSSEMNVVQRGAAAAIRVDRQNNKFILENNSKINAQNVHTNNSTNGTVDTGGPTGNGQQAIQFPEDLTAHKSRLNEFVVSEGSILQLLSLQGPSLDFDGSFGRFDVVSGAQIEIVGNPRTASAGIIQSRRELDIEFDNPLFLDLRNNRLQGNIFTVPTGSSLKATNSDITVWRKGSNLDSDPDLNFPTLDYSFTGTNFNTLETTNQPEILNTDTFGNTGLTSYSRLSSNNARWAIADELRVSTNADKKIHGHISIPVGLDDSRSAWENEATIVVEVERISGAKKNYTSKTVGHSNDKPGISIYGEEPRGGLFEIDLDEPLEAGSKIRIIKVELTSGELTEGFDHQILTDTMEVFPIIPPTPAKFSSPIIGKGSRSIQGYSENKEAEVTAMHNGKQFSTENVIVNKDGTFTLNLNDISLEEDDKIQVFLRDSAGLAETAGVINPPETNNNRGNINPSAEFTFRDVTFEPATILTVGDVGQVFPVDPLDPEKEVDPENQPELPENQGQLSVDFVSSFNFGSQPITANDQTYYAQPQRLLNADGTVNETEERPNYVQISDRRPENDRNGWQLAVTQNYPFLATNNRELNGARLRLTNQQLATAQGGSAPEFQQTNPLALVPGNRRILLMAQGTEGTGTWIYRFGDQETANKSVALDVPKGANPEAARYETTLTWELSAVPGN
ncbi:WxL domain-containing protein [Enterococcus mundtii]|uniref:WxL domain-containing protein n=2 Tax=Enterococcus mundtii TaxID=53346 RepID=A0A848MZW5_ENTMU|nr:WxL domain-containing protein [Enterococcus mundtii]